MTLLSIVTPSYNQAEYLGHAMDSVLAQEGELEIEYIVVDGGSNDSSVELIRQREQHLAWWVSEPDKGQAEAINKGFRRAQGEFVAWLNSDDLYLPGTTAQAVEALRRNPDASMVYGDALTIDTSGRPLNVLAFPDWELRDLAAFRIICQPAVFLRRAALEQAGPLDESYHYMLDHHLWLRVAQQGEVIHVPRLWAAARHHPQAKNVAHAARFAGETARLLGWMEQQPAFRPLLQEESTRVRGGAQRLRARYLLDGGLAREALRAYASALRLDPPYAMRHWHRMIYAVLSMAGASSLANWYYRLVAERASKQLTFPELRAWPGLLLEER